ncbi:PREDICTED: major facilitator superfamily domain-containing protein 6-like [Cyphomyrmex costatus]|uniref:major facilitator superfamily domain-containing protein 6-like n=1 Tax=Cyphomyrmex costatus TaxID=456900 RepID=UPI00085239D8|nr:PREDICTED: major facilitator superfamily domain-containing protein 6-like [Cyphomyrmex costatus]
MKINYTQLYIKAHYFFFFASCGITYPYIPVYGRQLGISPLVLGIICTIFPILHLIAKPAFSFLVDYFGNWRKLIFMVFVIATGGSYIIIFFLPLPSPMLLDQHLKNISCTSLSYCDMEYHASEIASCNGTIDTTCHWICKDTNFSMRLSFYTNQNKVIVSPNFTCLLNINETLLCQKIVTNNYNCNIVCDNFENQCIFTSITFWIFILLWCLGDFSYFTSLVISDTICFSILGQGKQSNYGKQRLWATIGYGIAACLSGYMIDLWSHKGIYKTYTPILVPVAIFICIDLICCIKLKMSFKSGSTTIIKDVTMLLKSKSVIIFLCFVIFSGMLNSIKRTFLLWYVEDLAVTTNYMSNIKLIEGLITMTETFGGEVISFFFSGKIIDKLGYTYTLISCFVCYAFRLGLISLSTIPWWILPIELLLHGPSYAICLTTITAYANSVAPPGSSATVQGLIQGMHDNFGFLIGNLVVGVSYEKFGGTITMRIFSVFAALSAIVYFLFHVLYLKHKTSDLRNNIEWRKPDDAQKHCVIAGT